MKFPERVRTVVVAAISAILLTACEHNSVDRSVAVQPEDVPCRSRGTRTDAIEAAQEWIARHKNRQFTEVIDDVSWHGDLWQIGFTVPAADWPDYAVITTMPDGEIVRCEASVNCVPVPVPARPACPTGQMRIATEAQVLAIAASFLEKSNIPVDSRVPPRIYSRPAWYASVLLEPPTPGGDFMLLISADGEVVGTLPGE